MRTDKRADMAKLIVAFPILRKHLTIYPLLGTEPRQTAALNATLNLGGPHLQAVRGAEMLMAHFVTLSGRF